VRDTAADAWRSAFLRMPYLRDAMARMSAIVETFETATTWDRVETLWQAVTTDLGHAIESITGAPGLINTRLTHVYPDGAAPYFTVIATGRRAGELEKLKKETGAQTLAGDLNDAGFAEDLAGVARDAELFVNNAGVLKYAPFLDMSDEDTEAMFRTNVLAAFRISRLVAQAMVRRGRGHIIVMTSIAAREVYPFGLIYCATKHALSAMARGLRVELQPQGIKVTEIAPGSVDTKIRASTDHPRVLEAFRTRKFSPLSPNEVAEAVLFAAQAAPNVCPDLIELRPRGSA
jgi:NADP-dependent 3-hydroxy acid dehydrogenase YdfG